MFINAKKLPKKSHDLDCGLDCFTIEPFSIEPLETKTIGLGFSVEIPEGYAGMLVPRSSIAKKGLICQTSIIDPGYTGEVHLIITNCSNNTYHFNENDRIVSLIVYNILNPILNPINDRGSNGLGSTNK